MKQSEVVLKIILEGNNSNGKKMKGITNGNKAVGHFPRLMLNFTAEYNV